MSISIFKKMLRDLSVSAITFICRPVDGDGGLFEYRLMFIPL